MTSTKQAQYASAFLEELRVYSEDEGGSSTNKRAKLGDVGVDIVNSVGEASTNFIDTCSVTSHELSDFASDSTVMSNQGDHPSCESELDSFSNCSDSTSESCCYDNMSEKDSIPEPAHVLVCQALKALYSQYAVTLTALGALLVCLKPFFPGLPKDPRTVLSIQSDKDGKDGIQKMGDGQYYNFGLKEQVKRAISKCPPPSNTVELNFNIDGLPLSKSGKKQYWPILFTMQHAIDILPPLIASIFCGIEKPKLTEFFKDFVPELTDLLCNGMLVGGTQYFFKVRCFVCDAPARSYIKGTFGHNSYNGCDFCEVTGKYERHVMFFTNFHARLRTDESFAKRLQENHHRESTPLSEVPGMKMVSMFPMDYMHQILIGVVKRFLVGLFAGNKLRKLNPTDIRIMDTILVKASKMWPSDFSRKPRFADDVKRWKATEFRQFLLYIGPGVLKSRMRKEFYHLFLHVHVAITILCRKDLLHKFSSLAHRCLLTAASMFRKLYGDRYVVYNVHLMIHLTEQALRFGVLDLFSGFPYESHLATLKRLTRSMRDPLTSLVNRLKIDQDVNNFSGMGIKATVVNGPVCSSWHLKGPKGHFPGKLFRKYHWNNCTLSLRMGDNFVILRNKKVLQIKNFVSTLQGDFVVGTTFNCYADAYSKPCKSSKLGIYLVWDQGARPKTYSVHDIEWKAVLVPFKESNGKFIAFPMRQ